MLNFVIILSQFIQSEYRGIFGLHHSFKVKAMSSLGARMVVMMMTMTTMVMDVTRMI